MSYSLKMKMNKVLLLVIVVAVSTVFIIPILMMLLGSLKTQGEVLLLDLSLPSAFRIENYIHVLETGSIMRGYMNSLITTVSSVILILFCGSTAGIIISRRSDRTSSALYYYFIFGLTATFNTVTTYALMLKLNLYGTYFGVIMVFTAINLSFAVLTFSSFVKGVPREIDEAAIVDGSGPFTLIFRILMPILKPVLVTNLIIAAIGVWNNFMVPLYLMNSSAKMTIPLTVFNFYGLYARDWQFVFAALTITILPVVVLYLCMQRYIVEGMTAGAVKG
ncbi:MAG: carbohydrate ABC transporter permease [Candidatus Pristimantibacillus lignocellulolyticus]|uniref:Carbohydrate ABC transporter permease n=1 Tax=Candidatus Pristimantibacillus lignocellulolyticus TaxID=2994561 RepID=A0A9J6ZGW6_9BACL|nr:MAG: carbohydrate ABC transporter permease [Candidatus Pristimantibacillus lignocellulolyticus]